MTQTIERLTGAKKVEWSYSDERRVKVENLAKKLLQWEPVTTQRWEDLVEERQEWWKKFREEYTYGDTQKPVFKSTTQLRVSKVEKSLVKNIVESYLTIDVPATYDQESRDSYPRHSYRWRYDERGRLIHYDNGIDTWQYEYDTQNRLRYFRIIQNGNNGVDVSIEYPWGQKEASKATAQNWRRDHAYSYVLDGEPVVVTREQP